MQFRVYQEYYQILQGTGAKVLFDIKFSIYGCWTDSRRGAVSAILDTTSRTSTPPNSRIGIMGCTQNSILRTTHDPDSRVGGVRFFSPAGP